MTTDRGRWVWAPLAVLGGWLAVLTLVMALTDAAPAALVPMPGEAFLRNLPPDIAIVSRTALSVTLAAAEPGLASALYGAGAMIVLPAGLTGCDAEPGVEIGAAVD